MTDYAHINTSRKPSIRGEILEGLAFVSLVVVCVLAFAVYAHYRAASCKLSLQQ